MIKPKYKKGMDLSQIARALVERAVQVPLTPSVKINPVSQHLKKKNHASNEAKPIKSS